MVQSIEKIKKEQKLVSFRTAIPHYEIFALRSESTNGQPIVLVHGAVASHRYMIPTAKVLSNNRYVLVPDLPGHGGSSKPEHALTPERMAEALHTWLTELGIAKADFLANSYGCQIMTHFAVAYPQCVDHLILTDPTGDPGAKGLWQQFWRLFKDGFVEPPFAPLMMFLDIFDLGWTRQFETAHNMKNDDVRGILPHIQAKTIVIRGENDFISPQKWCEVVTRLIPGARLEVIPNAPHSVNSATAVPLCQIVNRFLSE
ncbi:MAG TPA: alpha/beta hydrolase [Planktothrix sp.]|jgi:pimeloyl-ACP methyl ester carboxylesterase